MTDREAFLEKVLGTPYDRIERQCFWLASKAQRELFGRALPVPSAEELAAAPEERARLFRDHPARREWRLVPQPVDGAHVFMSRRLGPGDVHCGIYLVLPQGGRVLHTNTPHGVVLDTLVELRQVRGWRPTFLVPV